MPGPPKKHNYEALYQEFLHLKTQGHLTLAEFCESRHLGMTQTSTQFAELKRQAELKIFRSRNTEILLVAQSKVSESLNNKKLPATFKANYALDSFKAIADREGMSPQAQTINIKNAATAIGQAIIAPLFEQEPEEFKTLLGGE